MSGSENADMSGSRSRPLRLLVTGRAGQVALALAERAEATGHTFSPLARPEVDLTADADTLTKAFAAAIAHHRPDAVISAAAYTAVDLAETNEDEARAVNATAPGLLARAAADHGLPILHLSTDYVFDGTLDRPYREDDPVNPLSAYGRTKLAGEIAVADANPDHAILRTAWVYSPFGKNFVRTMLRLGETRSEVGVVVDQFGCPTGAHAIADALIAIAATLRARPDEKALRGLFHLTGSPDPSGRPTSWADFATAIFKGAERHGRAPVTVRPITTADYPTPARRPANSRLDGTKLAAVHGLTLPPWPVSLEACLDRLLVSNPERLTA
jgi:dTDP-4-dehydrorhamnose reductase